MKEESPRASGGTAGTKRSPSLKGVDTLRRASRRTLEPASAGRTLMLGTGSY